jgi:hypothetical protein
VTDNPIAHALLDLAAVVGRRASLLFDAAALDDLRSAGLSAVEAVALCDHDTPDRDAILALLLDGEAGYVAMMGSKPRAAATYAELSGRYDDAKFRRLHVPAGLNIGGKGPARSQCRCSPRLSPTIMTVLAGRCELARGSYQMLTLTRCSRYVFGAPGRAPPRIGVADKVDRPAGQEELADRVDPVVHPRADRQRLHDVQHWDHLEFRLVGESRRRLERGGCIVDLCDEHSSHAIGRGPVTLEGEASRRLPGLETL